MEFDSGVGPTCLDFFYSSIGEHGDLIATSINSQNELENLQEAESRTNLLSAVQAISSSLTDGHNQMSSVIAEGHEKVATAASSGHDKLASAFTDGHEKIFSALSDGHEKVSGALLNTNNAIDIMTGAIKVSKMKWSRNILNFQATGDTSIASIDALKNSLAATINSGHQQVINGI